MPAPVIKKAVPWKWIGAGALALVVAAGAWTLRSKFGGSAVVPNNPAAHAPVSVLVADFTNHTGDPIFDGTLEPMFNVALEGASFVNAYSRGDARKVSSEAAPSHRETRRADSAPGCGGPGCQRDRDRFSQPPRAMATDCR